jgi:hypothetical protein
MFLHNVHYWLKPDLSESEKRIFLDGIADLMKLRSVRRAWFGPPAGSDPLADRTFDYSIVLDLGDAAGHDDFQADPAHQRIRDAIGGSWERLLIYDVAADGGR